MVFFTVTMFFLLSCNTIGLFLLSFPLLEEAHPTNFANSDVKEHTAYVSSRRLIVSVQFSSVAQSCPTPWDPMNCSTTGLPAHHQLPEFIRTHAHWVGDAIQPSHPLSSPCPPAFNLYQHQGPFKWISSSHQVAKVLEFQLQHQSFQWTPSTDLL